MKKLFVILMLLVPSLIYSQVQITPRDGHLITNFDLTSMSGTDTTFEFQFPMQPSDRVGPWSMHGTWLNTDTTGTVYIKVTNYPNTAFIYYADSLNFSITKGVSGKAAVEDSYWAWKYGQAYISLDDTALTGTISLEIFYTPK